MSQAFVIYLTSLRRTLELYNFIQRIIIYVIHLLLAPHNVTPSGLCLTRGLSFFLY